jgi:hypothetical protein
MALVDGAFEGKGEPSAFGEPSALGEPIEFAKGEGAGMGLGATFREESSGIKLPEPGSVGGTEPGSVGEVEPGSVGDVGPGKVGEPEPGNVGCKPEDAGSSGNELSSELAPAPRPEFERVGPALSPFGTDGAGADRVPDSFGDEIEGIMLGAATKGLAVSSPRKGLLPEGRDVELAPGSGRYWSGGGSARAPPRF